MIWHIASPGTFPRKTNNILNLVHQILMLYQSYHKKKQIERASGLKFLGRKLDFFVTQG